MIKDHGIFTWMDFATHSNRKIYLLKITEKQSFPLDAGRVTKLVEVKVSRPLIVRPFKLVSRRWCINTHYCNQSKSLYKLLNRTVFKWQPRQSFHCNLFSARARRIGERYVIQNLKVRQEHTNQTFVDDFSQLYAAVAVEDTERHVFGSVNVSRPVSSPYSVSQSAKSQRRDVNSRRIFPSWGAKPVSDDL